MLPRTRLNEPSGKEDILPPSEGQIEALGINNWRDLERQVVKRLIQAGLSSLNEDLSLEGYQYGTAVSVLSVGYFLGQISSTMIIGKVRPSVYLCWMALVRSKVSVATCGVKDYQGLIAVRFFLGAVEAPPFPGRSFL
ncbi:MFS transporter [Colletotrichum orchidophilum]|uniref:MFS transporter n=1 Tax=Colletotrichum orchidophilum TaxID=1209926 RepID=A0A1G4B9Y1_9PEZI|nr:MFS transporter [Colletotrichum orchidophilum]OHE98211.1 MFS transporter [Colletotrichum orchidophilum]